MRTVLPLMLLSTACTPPEFTDATDPTIRCKRTDATDTLVVGQHPLIDITRYTHDDRWNETLAEISLTDAGVARDIVAQTFDLDDNLLSRSEDNGNDGMIDREEVYTYDDEGHQLTYTLDDNGDGVLDERTTQTWTGDKLTTKQVDNGADGTIDQAETYIYDGALLVRWEADITGDTIADGIATYAYSNSLLQQYEWDQDADGTIDERFTFSYDGDGNLTQQDFDTLADGTIDKRTKWSWQGGFIVRVEKDYEADNIADLIVLYTRDAHGNPTRTEYDFDADGEGDAITDETWVCEEIP